MLATSNLAGARFLDVGCGSGLMSLAAKRLGATVISFDYDPDSVACTMELRERFYPGDSDWIVMQGTALDSDFLHSLKPADVVYSWGVLHHTGAMWDAIGRVQVSVAARGLLFIAIYNDQGRVSDAWRAVKRFYCSGVAGRAAVCATFIPLFFLRAVLASVLQYGSPFRSFSLYKTRRGMSMYHDWIDWLGGYPFEVARPEDIVDFLRSRGFVLERMKTTNRLGCNEFVFRRT